MNSSEARIKNRILNGAVWLITNSYGWCMQFGKNYDPQSYERHLRLYEQLVDQARSLGIKEDECLQTESGLKVSEMSDDLILVYLCKSMLKNRNMGTTASNLLKKI